MNKNELLNILENKETTILEFETKEQWRDLRNRGIGGSDIGAILGVNKYRSMVDVFIDKTQGSKFEGNQYTYWGNKLEDVIREEFSLKNASKFEVFKIDYTMKYQNLVANVDGIVRNIETGEYGVLEIKTANGFSINDWSDGEVPKSYYAQVVHYLAVTGFKFAIIVVLIGGNDYREILIQRNEEEIKYIVESVNNFWNEYILTDTIPAPDGSDAYSDYQKEKVEKLALINEIEIDEELEKMIEKRNDLIVQMKEIETNKNLIDQQIMNVMIENDSEKATNANYKIKIVSQKRSRVDKKKFESENEELIKKYKEIENNYKSEYITRFLKIN